jgi:hypothetical protein
MAARRLMALLLVVLVVSTVAAALIAPLRQDSEPAPTEESTQAADAGRAANTADSGRLIQKSVQTPSKDPPTVRMRAGDQLELTVHARTPTQVEIPRLGQLEDAAPDAPAHFSILASSVGRFEARALGAGPVATILVKDEEPRPAGQEPGGPDGRRGAR